jgi:hypothetical protein
MKPLAFLPLSALLLATPAASADLDGPVYRERDFGYERSVPPRVVERERIIEHHHHHYAPPLTVYRERRVYAEPEVYYRPREYAYYDRYRYAHAGWWRPRHFFPRHHWGHWRHLHSHGW